MWHFIQRNDGQLSSSFGFTNGTQGLCAHLNTMPQKSASAVWSIDLGGVYRVPSVW